MTNLGVYEDILKFVKDFWFWNSERRQRERESLRMFAKGCVVFRFKLWVYVGLG